MKRYLHLLFAVICFCFLSACTPEEPTYSPNSQAECQPCNSSDDCCCGLTCKSFFIQGGALNGLPVNKCATRQTKTCPA